jgi:hypothetical protein
MNWKNVLFLLRVERKSGRLIRGIKTTRYRENSVLAYWPYWTAAIIGVLGGLVANWVASLIYSQGVPPDTLPLKAASLGVFVVLPTLVLIFSFVFTLLQQIQLAGVKASTQVMYWLPVTWQEHTLASILANLFGWPISLVLGISSGVLVFSAFNGLILPALLTVLVLFAAAFLASTVTESIRILQVRLTGAVYKSSGRAAIWVRLISSIFGLVVFYIIYFYLTQGFASFVPNLTAAQNVAWFVPFVWLALILSYLLHGLYIQGALFISLSALFIAGFYFLAVYLNQRFGLYEPPAISVQKSGVYAPKTGLLGKLGFSSVEAALIRKDFRAFTRRRELLSVYIFPIIIILIPLMQSLGITNGGSSVGPQTSLIFMGIMFLLPGGAMAMFLNEIMIGEEGQAVWRIYASPISGKNLVRSKFFFSTLFSVIIMVIGGAIGIVFYHPSLRTIIVAFLEALFLILALGSISLAIGFKGADFSQTRRARMIRQDWSLIAFLVCTLAAAVILAPLLPYVLASFAPSLIPGVLTSTNNIAISVIISGVISLVITAIFYRINTGLANDLLRKAQI